MKKLLICILMITVALTFIGCVERFDPIGNPSGGSNAGDGSTDNGSPSTPNGTPFTVQLVTQDDSPLPEMEDMQVQWTSKDGKEVHYASFDEEGVAYSYKPDGDYKVTLTSSFKDYAYNPNVYTADNNHKNVTIVLYPLQTISGGNGENGGEQAFQIKRMGVYRFKFNEPNETLFFTFKTSNGGYIYSIESYLDTTLDEVSPILTRRTGSHLPDNVMETISGGGASGKFTNNFKYSIATQKNSGADYLFAISLKTVPNATFPLYLDVLITNTGEEYANPWDYVIAEVPENIPTLDDINANYSGTFQAFADYNGKVLDQSKVRLCEDKYYHYDSDLDGNITTADKFLYIKLYGQIDGLYETYNGLGLMDPMENVRCYDKNGVYTSFKELVTAYNEVASYYPVNATLQEFLTCFAISKGSFDDGFGFSEQEGFDYVSGGDDRWLFLCGVFI